MGLSRPIKSSPATLLFGGQNAGGTTTRRWLGPGTYAGTIPTSARSQTLDAARVLTAIYIDCVAGTGSGNAIYTVYLDGVATAITVTFLNAAASASATGLSVIALAGQKVSVAHDKSGTITAGQTDIVCAIGAYSI